MNGQEAQPPPQQARMHRPLRATLTHVHSSGSLCQQRGHPRKGKVTAAQQRSRETCWEFSFLPQRTSQVHPDELPVILTRYRLNVYVHFHRREGK